MLWHERLAAGRRRRAGRARPARPRRHAGARRASTAPGCSKSPRTPTAAACAKRACSPTPARSSASSTRRGSTRTGSPRRWPPASSPRSTCWTPTRSRAPRPCPPPSTSARRGRSRELWERALERASTVIAHATFLTEGVRAHAYVVFPALAYPEKEGTVVHPDGRVQRLRPGVARRARRARRARVLDELATSRIGGGSASAPRAGGGGLVILATRRLLRRMVDPDPQGRHHLRRRPAARAGRAARRAQAARALSVALRPQPRRSLRRAAAARRHPQAAHQGAVPPDDLDRPPVRVRAGDLDPHRGRRVRADPVRQRPAHLRHARRAVRGGRLDRAALPVRVRRGRVLRDHARRLGLGLEVLVPRGDARRRADDLLRGLPGSRAGRRDLHRADALVDRHRLRAGRACGSSSPSSSAS